jgi:hypothetical protein
LRWLYSLTSLKAPLWLGSTISLTSLKAPSSVAPTISLTSLKAPLLSFPYYWGTTLQWEP